MLVTDSFLGIKLEVTGIFVHRNWTPGCDLRYIQIANPLTAWISHRRNHSEIHKATVSIGKFDQREAEGWPGSLDFQMA